MAKRSKKKGTTPTSSSPHPAAAPAAAPAKPSQQKAASDVSAAAGWWLRLGLAAGLALVGVACFLGASRFLRAELEAAKGRGFSRQTIGVLLAEEHLRKADRLVPYYPEYQFLRADGIVRLEASKAKSGAASQVNYRSLREAFDLMMEAYEGYDSPGQVNLRAAEMAGMISLVSRSSGDPQTTEYFAQAASGNYESFRRVLRYPAQEAEVFYRGAIRTFYDLGRPDLALLFWDDYRNSDGPSPQASDPYPKSVPLARLQMGEKHLYLVEFLDRLVRTPQDEGLYRELLQTSTRFALQDEAARFLRAFLQTPAGQQAPDTAHNLLDTLQAAAAAGAAS